MNLLTQDIASLREMATQALAEGDEAKAKELYTQILQIRIRMKRRNQLNWWNSKLVKR